MQIRPDIRDMICVAHDDSTLERVTSSADILAPYAAISKLGPELMSTPYFFPAVDHILEQDRLVFVDCKIHDVPETTRKAVRNLAGRGVHMCTIHLGDAQGSERLQAALENRGNMKILVVTVLTSIPRKRDVGMPVPTQVLYRARDARSGGADGIICSAEDLRMLTRVKMDFSGMLKFTPGIRPPGSPADDQQSIMTPFEAAKAGRDGKHNMHVQVIGRPLTDNRYNSGKPEKMAKRIHRDIAKALATPS